MANKGRGLASKNTAAEGLDRELRKPHGGSNALFRPEYGERVLALCKLGTTDKDLCLFFDVSYQTIENWKRAHPEFFVKLLKGKQEADGEVAESLFKSANGYDYYEEVAVKLRDTTYGVDGKVVSVEERVETVRVLKHKPAEVVAQIFWLKNRRPELWRDAKQIDAGPELLKATQQGNSLLSELSRKGFVELDGVYEIVGDVTLKAKEDAT